MIKYLHIGYPKNLSTTLQRDFFAVHPQIFHLGIGCGSNIDYVDDTVNAFFENYVRYCVRFKYDEKRNLFRRHFAKMFAKAEDEGKRAVGASCEHLSFRFTADSVDTVEKAERIREMFGMGAEILMIIRNQAELLWSLYREGVRVGYPGTFRDYIDYVYRFQDRNFVPDFQYHYIYQTYAGLFGKSHVHVLPRERYVKDGKLIAERGEIKLVSRLTQILGVDYAYTELGHRNPALAPQILEVKRRANQGERHDLGNTLWDGAENHRLGTYFRTFLDLDLPEETIFRDVRTKNRLIESARRQVQDDPSAPAISEDCDTELYRRLLTDFKESNRKLDRMLPENLPESYLRME
jgi:hypothetical protein